MTTNHPARHDAATLTAPKPIRVLNKWVAHALTFFGPGLIVMEADSEEGRNPMARPAHHLAALFVCFVIAAGAQDSSSEARRMNNEAAALYAAGKFEAAGRLYRAALALQPGDPLIVAAIAGNLGALYKRQNRYAEAERMYQEALDLRRKWLPLTRPEVAYSMNNLAEIYRLEGRYFEARSLTEAAVDALRRSDPASPYMPVFLNNLGGLERNLHRLDKADPLLQQAYRLAETSSGPESRVLAIVLNSQGQLLTDKQDFETAERLYRRSAAILENSGQDQAGELAVALANMGRVLGLLGRNEEARQTELRALTLLYSQPCRDDLLYATILRNLGTLAAAEDHMADSLTYFDQSLAAQERILGPDHPLIADVLFDYAAAEQRAGAKSKAQRLRKRAERLMARQRRDDLSRYTVDAAAFQNLR
jgi:tetratricopeptide (TPR) repeat protein